MSVKNIKKLALAALLAGLLGGLTGCFIQPDPTLDPLQISDGTVPFGTVQALPTNTPTPVPQETAAATTYKTLRRGDRGKEVVSMQEALIKLGYLKGASDGNFGTGTKTAVENFQKENGLDVDGIAGAKTLEKLYNLADMTPIPDTTAAPGDILDLPG